MEGGKIASVAPMRLLSLFLFLPTALAAQTMTCPDPRFSVTGDDTFTARVCDVAQKAADSLSACNLPITRPVEIEITRDIQDNCVGLYHCGKDRIEILHPETLSTQIDESALFSNLDTLEYFDSILFHELVHAAYDEVPCPFPSCTATSEYLAYALQIGALGDEARRRIDLGPVPEDPVSPQRFSAIMAFWAPDRFAVNAWAHLMQRPDPCAYVGRIVAGEILFDSETPLILSPPE